MLPAIYSVEEWLAGILQALPAASPGGQCWEGTRLGQPAPRLGRERGAKGDGQPKGQKGHWLGKGLFPHLTGGQKARPGEGLASNPADQPQGTAVHGMVLWVCHLRCAASTLGPVSLQAHGRSQGQRTPQPSAEGQASLLCSRPGPPKHLPTRGGGSRQPAPHQKPHPWLESLGTRFRGSQREGSGAPDGPVSSGTFSHTGQAALPPL